MLISYLPLGDFHEKSDNSPNISYVVMKFCVSSLCSRLRYTKFMLGHDIWSSAKKQFTHAKKKQQKPVL